METSEIPKGVTPLDAVSDAVMASYARQIINEKHFGRYPIPETGSAKTFDFIVSMATEKQCHLASIDTVYFLTKKYPDLFKKMFLVSSEIVGTRYFYSNEKMTTHTYFVALGSDNLWYAGSPANHNFRLKDGSLEFGNGESYALSIIKEPDLTQILSDITKRDGGVWPDATELTTELNSNIFSNPILNKKGRRTLKIFEHKVQLYEKDDIVGMFEEFAGTTHTELGQSGKI